MYYFETYKIDDLQVRDLIIIRDILRTELGFKEIEYQNIINHIAFVCICKTKNFLMETVVGIGAIKKSNNKEFKKSIFVSADRLDVIDKYTNELGYLWTSVVHRKKGIATNIIKNLLTRYYEKNSGNIFATVKADNTNSINTLLNSNFEISISPTYNIENFVNIKTENVLKLLFHNKEMFEKQNQDEKSEQQDNTVDNNENVENNNLQVVN